MLLVCLVPTFADSQLHAKKSIHSWPGCYELRIAPDDKSKKKYGAMPRLLRLLPKRHVEDDFAVVKILDRENDWPFSSWKADTDDILIIDFGTGFVGYSLTVRQSESRFPGTAQPWSDDGSHTRMPVLNVELRQISCSAV